MTQTPTEAHRQLRRLGAMLAHAGRTIALVIEQLDATATDVESVDLFVPIGHTPPTVTTSVNTIDREVS